MITCLDRPLTSTASRTRQFGTHFPLHNPGLRLLGAPPRDGLPSASTATVRLPSVPRESARRIELTTFCHAPLGETYAGWMKCGHLPPFMRAQAEPGDGQRAAPGWNLHLRDAETPWTAVTTERIPLKRISWWGTDDGSHPNRGSVSFAAAGRRTTKVTVTLEFYESPTSVVTEETLGTLRTALDRSLDLLHLSVMPCSTLGPGGASL